jgi:hypothetical protein
MKTKKSYSIIRLMMAVILVLTSFPVASCDKDEDDDPNRLIGRWELTWMDGFNTESYNFYEDGYGDYRAPHKDGYFWYSIDSPGNIRFNITYHEKSGSGSYKDVFVWPYSINGDKLTLNGKTYTRKESVKPIELQ